ncbi:MAG: AMP-binding protein [Desulfobacterales bacterium]|jgi:phenylacetate-CoA ligase|nr:AMP-binding protein [Desulfobacterales bacterium]
MIDRRRGYFDRKKEKMSKGEREAYLKKRLSEILRFGYRHSKAIRSRFDAVGLMPKEARDLKDLERLPITKKADLVTAQKETPPLGGFEVVPKEGLRRIYISPGPVFEPGEWDYEDTRWAQALYASGIRKGDVILNTFNYHLTPLAFMLDESLEMLRATVVPIGPGNVSMQIQLMRQLHVTGFLGTPSFLMAIVEAAEGMHLDLKKDLHLKVAFVGAEMFPESLRQRLEGKLEILLRQVYGTVDVGCLGYECSEKNGMHIPEDVIVEIVDTETGRQLEIGATGEIVATTFSKIFPMIRFATGDLSYLIEDPCPCGRTSMRLGKILGRTDQVTKVFGIFIHPWQVDEVMAQFPMVANYQVVVTRKEYRDEMTIYIELEEEVADKANLKRRVEKEVQEVLKVRGEVVFVQRGGIPDRAKKIDDRRIWE